MRTYEALVILKPILDVDNSDNVLKSIEDTVESLGGKVLKKDKLGRKRLAYEVNKFKDGFITTYQFSLDPATVVPFKRACQLNEDILRTVLVSREKVDLNDATIYGRDRSSERPERGERGERHFDRDRGDRHDRGERRERPIAGARPSAD